MKKAPKIGAFEWNLLYQPFFRARPTYFFAAGFLAVLAFFFFVLGLVAAIDLFSLTSNFAIQKIAM